VILLGAKVLTVAKIFHVFSTNQTKKVEIREYSVLSYMTLFNFVQSYSKHYIFMLQHWFKDLVERHAFGACQYLGERMRIAPSEVRRYFIYTSFIGMGSPLIIYLVLAFWVNIRRYIRRGYSPIYD
jgi:phage shock protein C